MEKIALLPGGFKPPHAGHYNMAKWLAANTDADSVVIKIGSKERDGITRDISLELWDLYRKADEDSNKLVIVPSEQNSPVRDVYDFIEQEAPEGSTIYLGMGEKDEEDQRFQNIGKFAEPKGIEFKTILVPPQAGGVSGTEMRGFISDGDKDSFQKYLPDHLSSEQKDKAWEIVTTKPEIEEDLNESGADTSWEDEEGNKITLEDILDLTKDIEIKDYPTEKLAKVVLNWDDNPEEIDRISQVEISKQYPILIMVDEDNKIQWILDGNHRAQKALRAKSETIPAKLIKPSNLNDKAKKIFNIEEDFYSPENKTVDFMRSSEWKAGYRGKKDIPRKGDQIHNRQKTRGVVYETRGGESEFHIYDFDETIARSLTPIPYEILSPEGIKTGEGETTSKDFEKDQEELHNLHGKNNVIFNFKAFEKQIENAIINDSIFNKLIKSLEDPNVKTTILTARTVGQPVTRFLKNVGLDAYVEALGVHKQGEKVTGQDKADWIEKRLKKTTKKIYFVDDSESNRSAVSLLQDKYPEVKFEIEDPPEIEDEEKVDEMMAGTMNKQEKRKHKRKLKKIKKGLKKYNKKNRYFEVPKNWRGSLTRKSKTRKTRRKKLNENNTISTALINDIPIPLETMNTHEQQIRGMMGRDSLEGGMLFPYDNIQKRDFHMEGCKIPLDIIFIAQDKINKIHHDCPPCKTNNCPQYSGRADNVLELPGGFCKKNNINQGDNINLNINPNIPEPKIEENVFTKAWWKDIINEMLLKEGGAAGHMAHPFNLPNVNSGRDLLDIFQKSSDSLQNNPGSVKIDGVNASIRLVDIDGEKQFVMDRGSKKELDIKGITKADLEDRFGAGHGMIKIGGEVLDMFNEALPSLQSDLEELGAWDDPNILFNMEYVSGKTNVQDYGSNFIAIHGLNKIESKEVQGKRKMLTQRSSTEISYSKDALQSLLDNLAPIAKEKDFEVHGSVPTTMDKDPNFNSALSKTYTIEAGENTQTKSLKDLLNELNNIPEEDFIFMNIDGSQKKVGAVSKQVYLAILEGKNINELFDDEEDRQKAIEGFTTYLATEKLGDEILKVLNSPMGSVEDHEGVVIRDENIADVPFKITGKFILGGLVSDF